MQQCLQARAARLEEQIVQMQLSQDVQDQQLEASEHLRRSLKLARKLSRLQVVQSLVTELQDMAFPVI